MDDLHIRVHLEDGALWATVDEYPGVFAAGDNLAELRESLQEGISLVVERPVALSPLEPVPVETAASAHLVPA